MCRIIRASEALSPRGISLPFDFKNAEIGSGTVGNRKSSVRIRDRAKKPYNHLHTVQQTGIKFYPISDSVVTVGIRYRFGGCTRKQPGVLETAKQTHRGEACRVQKYRGIAVPSPVRLGSDFPPFFRIRISPYFSAVRHLIGCGKLLKYPGLSATSDSAYSFRHCLFYILIQIYYNAFSASCQSEISRSFT